MKLIVYVLAYCMDEIFSQLALLLTKFYQTLRSTYETSY